MPLASPNFVRLLVLATGLTLVACGPRAHIPLSPLAAPVPGAVASSDSGAELARTLAPTLYLQTDESFPLSRVVAAVHPTRRVIAYYLLWRDDALGAWIPFTVPTDEEVMWVGYDTTGAPTDLWSYWHGTVLHADWRGKGQVVADIQWGKHGTLPRNVIDGQLPAGKTLRDFYLLMWIAIPDMLLGRATRAGPSCFCHGYARYRDFSRPLFVGNRLDAVVRTANPDAALRAIFGHRYSHKPFWPPEIGDR
ncbi:MAG: hypothetical protein ABJD07_09915 [Gemmatimonadaceae bacterium]